MILRNAKKEEAESGKKSGGIEEEAAALEKAPAAVPSIGGAKASGIRTQKTDKAVIDYSHTEDGYVMVQYTGKTDRRIKTQVKYLSGGEKARLALAKELKNGGNFLILDEPTNDLDLPTLRILEEALAAYDSTILVVSHDRYFLNRVCNHILAFDEPGHPSMDVGDYDYYASRRKIAVPAAEPEKKKEAPAPAPSPKKSTAKKLSYLEDRELTALENTIPELEEEIATLEERFNDPASFTDPVREMKELTEQIGNLKAELEKKYARWEELSEKLEELRKNS